MLNSATEMDRDPEEWGHRWVNERLTTLEDDLWLSPDQKTKVRHDVDTLIEQVGSFNVALLIDCAGWSTLYSAISWHVEALDTLSRARGGDSFIERLKRSVAQDAASILELVWRFASIDVEVELEPKVKVNSGIKRPDMALRRKTGDLICLIEAASNGDSEDQSATDGFKKRIQSILFENGFMNVLAGGFARVLNEEEVEMFAQSLKAAVEKLETSPNQLICVEGAYKLVVSKDCGDGSHEKVCEANGIKPRTLAYPPFDPREEVRTLRKLKKELLHFPIGSPALIVIEASPLMVLIQDKRQRFLSLRDALRTWMEAQENLFAIVVTLRCLGPQPRNVVLDNWDILIEQSLGMTALDQVILFNPSYERDDKDNLIKLVTEAFLKDYCSTPLPGR